MSNYPIIDHRQEGQLSIFCVLWCKKLRRNSFNQLSEVSAGCYFNSFAFIPHIWTHPLFLLIPYIFTQSETDKFIYFCSSWYMKPLGLIKIYIINGHLSWVILTRYIKKCYSYYKVVVPRLRYSTDCSKFESNYFNPTVRVVSEWKINITKI